MKRYDRTTKFIAVLITGVLLFTSGPSYAYAHAEEESCIIDPVMSETIQDSIAMETAAEDSVMASPEACKYMSGSANTRNCVEPSCVADAEMIPGEDVTYKPADTCAEDEGDKEENELPCIEEPGSTDFVTDEIPDDIDSYTRLDGYVQMLMDRSLGRDTGTSFADDKFSETDTAALEYDESASDYDSSWQTGDVLVGDAEDTDEIPAEAEEDGIENLGSSRYDAAPMTEVHRRVYNSLKKAAYQIASGKQSTNTVTIQVSSLGMSKTKFTPKDLGLTAAEFTFTGSNGALYFTDEAKTIATARIREQAALVPKDASNLTSAEREYKSNRLRIMHALRADLPYETYWLDSQIGWNFTAYYEGTTASINLSKSYFTVYLGVFSDYCIESGSNILINTDKTGSATEAVSTAFEIVADAEEECIYDADKLAYFRKRLIELSPLDSGYAASKGGPGCQLVNVFDGDANTKASGQGYARAFKYLCDLSEFRYPEFDCYIVEGKRNSIDYIWNVVLMDDGLRYLVDIAGGGNEQTAIMLGKYSSHTEGSDSYTYTCGDDVGAAQTVTYVYGDSAGYIFAKDELVLSDEDYDTGRRYLGGHLYAVFDTPEIDGFTPGFLYTGGAIKPEVTVYNTNSIEGDVLRLGTDYSISYSSNIKAGRACIRIKGKGNYTSSANLYFDIIPVNMSEIYTDSEITLHETGKALKPVPKVYWKDNLLKAGRDYTFEYYTKVAAQGDISYTPGEKLESITEAGEYLIRITGKGNFDEDTYVDVLLYVNSTPQKPKGIGSLTITAIKPQPYLEDANGLPIPCTPSITVKDGKKELKCYVDDETEYDYRIVSYSKNTSVGTGYVFITGDGSKYTGSRSISFKITGTPISKAKVYGLPSEVPYAGEPRTFNDGDIKLYVGMKALKPYTYKEDTGAYTGDYTISYSNNILTGKATVTFTGRGAYTGTLKKTFKITKRSLDAASVKVEAGEKAVYTKAGAKPVITVMDGTRLLTEGVDYTCSYSGNKKISTTGNQAKVTVKGKGNYTGTRLDYFNVVPADLSNQQNITVYAPDIAVSKVKAGNYKSALTVSDVSGAKLRVGSDITVKYFRYESGESQANEGGEPQELDPTDSVSPGEKVSVVVYAAPGSTKYTGNTEDNPFYYEVLEKSNDISSKGVFKIAPQEYTGNEITIDAGDFLVAKPDSGSTVELVCGRYDPNTGAYPADCDFIIIGYTNNLKKGNAKVTLMGVNNYSGIKTITFKIGAKKFLFW